MQDLTDTIRFGVGAFELNADMARKHGFSSEEIGAAADALAALSNGFYQRVAARQGFCRLCDLCGCWTGLNACHLCERDAKQVRKPNKRRKV